MSGKQQAFLGGTVVHKELQGFAAFVAYYQGCHQSGGSVTKAMLEASIGQQFFGDAKNLDSIGLAEQLVRGMGLFSSLYENCSPTKGFLTPTSRPPTSSLIMKQSLHCMGSHVVIPVGGAQGISLPLLLQSKLTANMKKNSSLSIVGDPQDNELLIKPRTLLTRAQEVARNGKKALACVMATDSPYKDYVKTGNLPSGMNHDDYLQFVREKMYVVLNPSKRLDGVVETADSTGVENPCSGFGSDNEESPKEISGGKLFAFPGYVVFPLMGPIVEDFEMLRHRSDLLMTSTPIYSSADKKLAGRMNARKVHSSESKRRRKNLDEDDGDDTSSKLTRNTIDHHDDDQKPASAPTLSECIQAAGIAQSRLADRGKKKAKVNDRIVAMHLKRVTGKQSMIQEQKFLISVTDHDDQNRQLYLQELRKLQQELASAINDLTLAEEQIIEDEVADASQQNNVDIMIDATISSILDNNAPKTQVSPMPPFRVDLGEDDELLEGPF